MQPPRRQLIVIHGWGGTFVQALKRVRTLFDFESRWENGAFVVDRREGAVLRQILSDPAPGPYRLAFRKLVISRLLDGCFSETPPGNPGDPEQVSRFPESALLRDFVSLGIPLGPGLRRRRARQLYDDARRVLDPILPVIADLEQRLKTPDGTMATEAGARALIRECGRNLPVEDLVALLENLRDMQETGGDLDTVASAVLYAHGLTSQAAAEGRPLTYGRDYRFVFLNYHESLLSLADLGPGDLLMADLPIGAFSSFESDVRALSAHGIRVARFDDHHPFTRDHRDMLARLEHDGLLPHLALSGPPPDIEPDPDQLKCAADMVYESTIEGRPWDGPGARALRRAAHAEDFVRGRTELGQCLTDLIKGGFSKAELAQTLLDAVPADDALTRIRARGWDRLAADRRREMQSVEERLSEDVFLLEFERPADGAAEAGGEAYGPGSDMPLFRPHDTRRGPVRVLAALAPRPEPGEPRLTVGRAAETFSRTAPEADYLFYCYGSDILVARRLNQADLALNLGALMPRLGAQGDGGHSGAAVCRPNMNAAYPARLLGRVDQDNFRSFTRYLRLRFERMGYRPRALHSRSVRTHGTMRRGGRNLTLIALAAALIGLLFVLLHPAFTREAVRESNRDFYPHIGSPP